VIKHFSSASVFFSGVLSLITFFISPADAEPYTLTVDQGSGDGVYEEASTVPIWADPYAGGDPNATTGEPSDPNAPARIFDRWVGDTATVADVFASQTTLTMPAADVQLTARFKDAPRWTLPSVWTYFPADHHSVIFLFHGGNGCASCIAQKTEIRRFMNEASARGYALVAVESHNRSYLDEITWDETADPAANIDMQRVAAAHRDLTARGLLGSSESVYLFGVSGGGMFASLFDQQAQAALNFPVVATALMVSPGHAHSMATTPTIFIGAVNDQSVPYRAIVENFDKLIDNNVPTQLWVSTPTPLYPEQFWRIEGLAKADSENIYQALAGAGFLDDHGYLINNPLNYLHWKNYIPPEYVDYLAHIEDQLGLAYAEHKPLGHYNHRILDFFANPSTVVGVKPMIAGFAPDSGAAGTRVTISGENFINITQVTFNGVSTTFDVPLTNTLLVKVPSGASTGPIEVTNSGGTTVSSTDFTVLGPAIASFTPTRGGTGSVVTIEGEALADIVTATVNGTEAEILASLPPTRLWIRIPDNAATGPIRVTNAVGEAVSEVAFEVVAAPRIDSVTPTYGAAGAVISLFGSHFTETTKVDFSGTEAAFTVLSDSEITATVPAGLSAYAAIRVFTPGGWVLAPSFFKVIE